MACPDPPLTADDIATAAKNPASAASDGNSVTAQPLRDQIEAAKFAAANQKNASGRRRRGWSFVPIIPPGPTSC